MTAKVTISLPDELLTQLDAEATQLSISRSELVQESVVSYLGKTADERAAEVRQARMARALEALRAFPEGRAVSDDRPALDILREVRGTDDAAALPGGGVAR